MNNYFQRLIHRTLPHHRHESKSMRWLEPSVSTTPVSHESTDDIEWEEEETTPSTPQQYPAYRSQQYPAYKPQQYPVYSSQPSEVIREVRSEPSQAPFPPMFESSLKEPRHWNTQPASQSVTSEKSEAPFRYHELAPSNNREFVFVPVQEQHTEQRLEPNNPLEPSVSEKIVERVEHTETHTIERALEPPPPPPQFPMRPIAQSQEKAEARPLFLPRVTEDSALTLQPPKSPSWVPQPEPSHEPRVVIGNLTVEVMSPEPTVAKAPPQIQTIIHQPPRPAQESGVRSPLRFGLGQL